MQSRVLIFTFIIAYIFDGYLDKEGQGLEDKGKTEQGLTKENKQNSLTYGRLCPSFLC